jgi:uncharacterized protein YjbI with pentapeptide repeats
MNAMHVARIMNVVKRTVDLTEFVKMKKATIIDDFLVNRLCDACDEFWQEVFPQDEAVDLSDVNLAGGVFAGIHSGAALDNANLRNGNFEKTSWLRTNMRNADFTGANLRKCVMYKAVCEGANFSEADLSESSLLLFVFDQSRPVQFCNADLSNVFLEIPFPTAMKLDGAKMNGCKVSFPAPDRRSNSADKDNINEAKSLFLNSLTEEQKSAIILEGSQSKQSKCFIATAAYGTDQAQEVYRLRQFRDTVLLRSNIGRAFVALYELLSPFVVRKVERSKVARAVIRNMVVKPALSLVEWTLKTKLK